MPYILYKVYTEKDAAALIEKIDILRLILPRPDSNRQLHPNKWGAK
jgi:hypothetical protein